ncbi:uncharacterized protein EDB91DRAFT_1338341 [Suillus paluster]|uniref:uncharacterized protein n=1 Tax=Suillus paluster TaxID=48578 RepID=UPI001B86F3D3|nr:uncharacterized protein EDB91DRAFT_1338341 [Suillus paluster]KAG1732416.1 hypothetical protein EDB91DRAFT_1338341 [Suillus paluster]
MRSVAGLGYAYVRLWVSDLRVSEGIHRDLWRLKDASIAPTVSKKGVQGRKILVKHSGGCDGSLYRSRELLKASEVDAIMDEDFVCIPTFASGALIFLLCPRETIQNGCRNDQWLNDSRQSEQQSSANNFSKTSNPHG